MKQKSSSSIFLLFAFLVLIICSSILPVLSLQSNTGISSYGTINYSTTQLLTLHVDGEYLKDPSGNIVILRGVTYKSDVWSSYSGAYNEAQFTYMRSWGCNVVRLSIQCYSLETGTDSNGNVIDTTLLSQIDNIISWARAHGMYVILNGFHQGGLAADGNTRQDCSDYLVNYWNNWNKWIGLWKFWANRYKGTGVIYELMSEPYNCPLATYQTETRACIDAIRAIDPNCICGVFCVGPDTDWANVGFQFEQTYPISRSNVVYIFHDYANHYLVNTAAQIQWKFNTYLHTDWMLANGRCVIATEYGAGGNGQDWNEHVWTDPGVAAFSTTWINNFYYVMDSQGFSGYMAETWDTHGANCLVADWNGNPNGQGTVIKNYYLAQ